MSENLDVDKLEPTIYKEWTNNEMVKNGSDIQNYWVLGLCPSSGILETRKHNVSETGSVSVLRREGKTPTQLGHLERANLNHWKRCLSHLT
jgi:hypothetical protein